MSKRVKVYRMGQLLYIPANEVMPGDLSESYVSREIREFEAEMEAAETLVDLYESGAIIIIDADLLGGDNG